jgi:hypothetical protein
MDLEIMTLPYGFRVSAALVGVVLMDLPEVRLLTVEAERVSAVMPRSVFLQGYSEMMCLKMNSVYYPPRTFRQPTVSIPLVIPFARQLSKFHSPLSIFP